MVTDDALGIAGRAGGVAEADGGPIRRPAARREGGIARGDEGLVVHLAQPPSRRPPPRGSSISITTMASADLPQRRLDDIGIFAVGDQDLRLAMLEAEGDAGGIEPGIEGVEHCADHGHAEMGLQHGRHIGRHDGDRVALPDAPAAQSRGQPAAALAELGIGEATVAMDDGGLLGIDHGRPLEQGDRRQRRIVGPVALEMLTIDVGRHSACSSPAGTPLALPGRGLYSPRPSHRTSSSISPCSSTSSRTPSVPGAMSASADWPVPSPCGRSRSWSSAGAPSSSIRACRPRAWSAAAISRPSSAGPNGRSGSTTR